LGDKANTRCFVELTTMLAAAGAGVAAGTGSGDEEQGGSRNTQGAVNSFSPCLVGDGPAARAGR
jgi:hypothetical protein